MKNIIQLTILISLLATVSYAQQPAFGDTVHAFNAGVLTPTPDTGLFGIAYVNGNLWINGWDPQAYYEKKFYKFNVDGSQLLDYFVRGRIYDEWKELAYDGEFLYVADKDTIWQLDTLTGAKTGGFINSPVFRASALAYDPTTDHFWTKSSSNNIYEIDRDGNVIRVIADHPDYTTTSFAIDTISQGGPYLWFWGFENVGYNRYMKARQFHVQSGQFTGKFFDGVDMSPPVVDIPIACTIIPDYNGNPVFAGLQHSNLNYNDGLDWVVYYNLADTSQFNGANISVSPVSIVNQLTTGDSLDVEVTLDNTGGATLKWQARIEPVNGTPPNGTLGDTLLTFDATALTPNLDDNLRSIAFHNGSFYVTGTDYGNDRPKIYQFTADGSQLGGVYNQPSTLSFGLKGFTHNGEHFLGIDQYVINKFVIDSVVNVTGYIINLSTSGTSLTYDPQKGHTWQGTRTGVLLSRDGNGDDVNFFVTPYSIEGVAWDQFSDGGPFIWAFVNDTSLSGNPLKIMQFDPNTGTATGVSFDAINTSGDAGNPDMPASITISKDWQTGKVVMIALQKSNTQPGDGHDKVVVYDLGVMPPPQWIELKDTTYGSIEPNGSETFTVRLKAIMSDTVMTTAIKISSNVIGQPDIFIPVETEMNSPLTTADDGSIPERYILHQNYPNPFNPVTNIRYSIPEAGNVSLKIYDILGNEIATLISGYQQAGTHTIRWDGTNLSGSKVSTGFYFYRLKAGNFAAVKKMLLMK